MTEFFQQVVNAISLGGVYALLALGLAIVYNIFGLINFAHGDLMTIAGYVIFFSLGGGIPWGLAIVFGILAAGIAAVLMERIAFRPLRGSSVPVLMLASIALGAALQVIFTTTVSARGSGIKSPGFLSDSISIGSFTFGVLQLISIVATIVLLVLLTLFLKRTTIGISMRAAAENFPATRLMGIKANRVIGSAFAISGILAGFAAVLWVAQRGTVDPLMGLLPMFKAFIATIIGGFGNLQGAVVGGFVLGFIEIFLQAYLPAGVLNYQDAIAFGLVIAILLWRPQGLVGRPIAERV